MRAPEPSPASLRPLRLASPRALRILAGLALTARERAWLVALGDEDGDGPELCDGAVLDELLRTVHLDAARLARLEALLRRRLDEPAEPYRGCSVFELAEIWTRRDTLRGVALAAYLWAVVTREGLVFRALEERVAREIEAMALAALARAPGRYPAPPHDPRERIVVTSLDGWEVRNFGPHDRRRAYFAVRGLGHLQLWHAASGVSVLTPSRLTAGRYEASAAHGWKYRPPDYERLRRELLEELRLPLPSAALVDAWIAWEARRADAGSA